MHKTGEKAAWEQIRGLGGEVSRMTGIAFEAGAFKFRSLGMDFFIRPGDETIEAADQGGGAFLSRFSYFFNHLALWWLVYSKGIPLAGRLVRPEGLPGGGAFFRGSHTLPLEGLAGRYGSDGEGFIERAKALGATGPDGQGGKAKAGPADYSAVLAPAPGLPVHILLWLRDEEFPARAEVLFSSSTGVILPLDVIWCAAMLCLLPML
ncbi:MAG: DUF3786 domain-containing protein [Nitrospiraceae bacterium]|nr:DUF3786 domain-containing protein [Nitrospiraceae bacterium]